MADSQTPNNGLTSILGSGASSMDIVFGVLAFVLTILVPYVVEQVAYARFTKRRAEKDEGRTQVTGYGWAYVWDIAHFLVLGYAGYKLIAHFPSLGWLDVVGVAIFVGGVALRIWALRELGDFYDTDVAIQKEHKVVDSGPYRLLRHPLHMGTDLQIVGWRCWLLGGWRC